MSSLMQKHGHVKGQRSNHHIFKFQPNPSRAKKAKTVTRPFWLDQPYDKQISFRYVYEHLFVYFQFNFIYMMEIENILLSETDLTDVDKILKIPLDDVVMFIRSDDIRKYLFPYKRKLLDMVPYKLMESNIVRMNELSSARTNAFSDIAVDKTGIRCVVSFGTLFKTPKVSYVYGVDKYGTDEESIRKHIFRHASVLKRLGTGSACMMFFIQENIEKFGKVANDICNRLSMKHVI